MGPESVPETPENFQTLAWPSARENFTEYLLPCSIKTYTTFLKVMNFLPTHWPRLTLQLVRFVGIYHVIIRNISPPHPPSSKCGQCRKVASFTVTSFIFNPCILACTVQIMML